MAFHGVLCGQYNGLSAGVWPGIIIQGAGVKYKFSYWESGVFKNSNDYYGKTT